MSADNYVLVASFPCGSREREYRVASAYAPENLDVESIERLSRYLVSVLGRCKPIKDYEVADRMAHDMLRTGIYEHGIILMNFPYPWSTYLYHAVT